MAKANIVYHNLRLNLDNEQHRRVHNILGDLNKDVHKSVNQFLIDAADEHISNLEHGTLIKAERKKEDRYLTSDDLEDIRREIREEVKDEMIRVLGGAFAAGAMLRVSAPVETLEKESEQNAPKDEKMTDLAQMWG